MPTEVIMPKVDMDMSAGTISAWHAADGQRVEKAAPLFDIETDKASMEIESPATGFLRVAKFPVGTSIPIGQAVAWIYADGEKPSELPEIRFESAGPTGPSEPNSSVQEDADRQLIATSETPHDRPRATPFARRAAREHGIQLAELAGSGPRGRIARRDVEAAVSRRMQAVPDSAQPREFGTTARIAPVEAVARDLRERIRLETARRLSVSNRLVPHLHLAFDVRIRKLMELRNELNLLRGNSEVGIEPIDFVLKATAIALKANPDFNAVWAGDGRRKLGGSDIALVVPAFGGQLAPVIREVERMTITNIATERTGLQARAVSGELSRGDCSGSAVAILDMSRTEAVETTSIVESPQSAMLAVGSIPDLPRSGPPECSSASASVRMKLSADNRVINSETAAAQIGTLKHLLEAPLSMLVL